MLKQYKKTGYINWHIGKNRNTGQNRSIIRMSITFKSFAIMESENIEPNLPKKIKHVWSVNLRKSTNTLYNT